MLSFKILSAPWVFVGAEFISTIKNKIQTSLLKKNKKLQRLFVEMCDEMSCEASRMQPLGILSISPILRVRVEEER